MNGIFNLFEISIAYERTRKEGTVLTGKANFSVDEHRTVTKTRIFVFQFFSIIK